ncbi:S8 family serine peptidase [Sedimentibacter sp. zth1]|uniref:S8 family serine peptidase n=1 Tax=Sedimentibacter sp. zth1 TaxID=2816908 RepID=UPI001A92008F|nr:S8 family serine peptidase [Sedimentibacter sp. zth1]QSX05272.1 S8 family serine peptidase [Sedimentibacter sp. zth1]
MKKFKFISLVLSIALIFSSFSFAFAVEFPRDEVEEVSNTSYMNESITVIVELEENPLLMYKDAVTNGAKEFLETQDAKGVRDDIISAQGVVKNEILENVNSNATFKYSYTNTLNGFVANIQRKDIAKIKSIQGVKNLYIDVTYDVPEPQMSTAGGMVSAPSTWKLGLKGEGTVVAVIDTGIDYDHEYMVLSDDTSVKITNTSYADVISGLNASKLVENLQVSDVYYNRKFPYAFDYADADIDATAEGSEHGVHVAGIVAANGTVASETNDNLHTDIIFDGVAPEAQIVVMKVFPSKDSGAKTSDTLAAIEDAITLGVDAMNLSLGSTAGFTFLEGEDLVPYEYEYTFERARNAGILLSVSAGNENRIGQESYLDYVGGLQYPTPLNVDSGLVGSPGLKYHTTCIASVENVTNTLPYIYQPNIDLRLKYADISEGTGNGIEFLENFDGQTLEYVNCGIGLSSDFAGIELDGKLALIQRGEISFAEKVANATSYGAIGAIVYNNKDEDKLFNMSGTELLSIPSCFIFMQDGLSMADAEVKTISVSKSYVGQFISPMGYKMSSFTSWGCTPDLKLKPELTTPGGQIFSTLPENKYGSMSGTSMAAPNAAGGMALMQQYVKEDKDEKFAKFNSEQRADIIENLLMSTAWTLRDEYGEEYSPRRQGAGLMNVEAAVKSDVYAVNEDSGKAKVELFDKIGDNFNIEFDLVNLSDKPYSYELAGSIFSEYAANAGPCYLTLSSISYLENSIMAVDGHRINAVGATTASAITGSAIVTATPNSTTHVTVNVNLSDSDTEYLYSQFENGFFVEGFIELLSLETAPDLSIPYMGFYGDWTDAPVIDGSYYYDSSLLDFYYTNSYAYNYGYDEETGVPVGYYRLGSNGYASNNENYSCDYSWIGFSPNGDGYLDEMGWRLNLLRNAKELDVKIVNSKNKDVRTLLRDTYYNKAYFYANGGFLTTEDLPLWDGKDDRGELLPDGQYYYVISAKIDYEGADYDVKKIPVKLDTQGPSVSNVHFDLETMTVEFDAIDEGYVSYADAYDLNGKDCDEQIVSAPDKTVHFEFDITDFDKNNTVLVIGDCAGNESRILAEEVDIIVIPPTPTPTPTPNPTPTPTPTEPEEPTPSLDEEVVVEAPSSSIKTEVVEEIANIGISEDVADLIKDGKSDTLDIKIDAVEGTKGIKINIPAGVVDELSSNGMLVRLSYGELASFELDDLGTGALDIVMNNVEAIQSDSIYTPTEFNYDIEVLQDGIVIDSANNNIKIELSVKGLEDASKAGVYTVDEAGNIEYVMTYLNGDIISFYPPHFSQYSVMVYNKTFDDIKGHWAQTYIEDMASKHIVNGKTETTFAPQDTITRAEFVTMVVRALALEGEGQSEFANMTGNEWYANNMSLAKDAGLIDGENYNATGIISRVEMAEIISKAHAILNGVEVKFDGKLKFTDVESDSEYAKFIGYAVENGLINGFPGDLYRPVENTTRAQAMTVIHKLLNK